MVTMATMERLSFRSSHNGITCERRGMLMVLVIMVAEMADVKVMVIKVAKADPTVTVVVEMEDTKVVAIKAEDLTVMVVSSVHSVVSF